MDEMQRRYEEELRILRDENAATRQERNGEDLVPSTPTFLGKSSLRTNRLENN